VGRPTGRPGRRKGDVMSARPGVLALIGNTPLVALRSFDTGPCELFVKWKTRIPAVPSKIAIGLSMIEAAEESGAIKPGATLVEATAGNTGLGLALVGRAQGLSLLLVIPDKMSLEKVVHLRALGVEVRMTRSDVGKGHPEYYQDMAQRIAGEVGGYYVNQFGNPANPRAHETTTGPEIWRQMDNRMDAMVCGVGSGGTITGLGRFFARHAPNVEMVLADPAGSVLAEHVRSGKMLEAGSWLVEGIGEDFLPPICDLSPVHHAYTVSDEDSLLTARALLRQEGILGRLILGNLGGCGVTLLPRAEDRQARGHIDLRQRQQVPVQDVQRLLDAGPRLSARPAHRRSARRDRPPPGSGRGGGCLAGRHASDRTRAA